MKRLLPLLLASCAPYWVAPVDGSADVPSLAVCVDVAPAAAPAVAEAIEGWDRALGNWRHLVTSAPPVCDYWIRESVTDDAAAAGHPDAMGWSDVGGTTAWLRR